MDREPAAISETHVVLLHPVNLTSRCWLPVASRLGDFHRVLIDSRGHGRSHMNGPFGIDDYAADVLAVIEALGLREIHIVGASLGGEHRVRRRGGPTGDRQVARGGGRLARAGRSQRAGTAPALA